MTVIVWIRIALDFDIKTYIIRKEMSCLIQKYKNQM